MSVHHKLKSFAKTCSDKNKQIDLLESSSEY